MSKKKKRKRIIQNGIDWYERNCTPPKQFEILEKLTNNLEILF
jgi:hypothetical protein